MQSYGHRYGHRSCGVHLHLEAMGLKVPYPAFFGFFCSLRSSYKVYVALCTKTSHIPFSHKLLFNFSVVLVP